MARLTAVFLRTGAKYAAVISQADEYCDSATIERTVRPIRDVIARGVPDKVLRDDLRGDAVFQMSSAVLERALQSTVGNVMMPEEATEAAVTILRRRGRGDLAHRVSKDFPQRQPSKTAPIALFSVPHVRIDCGWRTS